MTYLDTHIAAWLFGGEARRLSKPAAAQIQDDEVLVSPAVVLELQFLHEIKRLRTSAVNVVEQLARDIGLAVCNVPFSSVVEQALRQTWTRDPFDRLIVAQAQVNEAALITKDERIRRHYRRSIW